MHIKTTRYHYIYSTGNRFARITLITKLDEDITHKTENSRPMSLKHIDAEILNKMLASQIFTVHWKNHTLWSSEIYCRDGGMVDYLQINRYDTHINKLKNKNLSRCRKSFWQNSMSIYDKTFQRNGYKRDKPQHMKGLIMTNPQPTSYSMVKS